MKLRLLTIALLLAAATAGVSAQPHHGPPPPGMHFDERYHHDHYYPPRGYAVPVLPGGAVGIRWGSGQFYFHAGVWYRPYGGRFVVVVPPVGVIVPVLPPAYVSLWIGGAPYYYANGVYYTTAPGGYVVAAPPPGAEAARPVAPPAPAPAAPAAPPEPIIYPRNGQTAQQMEADRQECNRWATTQPAAVADASVFQRAVAACMDGRGYTVR